MALNYSLYDNGLVNTPEKRVAKTIVKKIYSLEDIFDEMEYSGFTLTKEEGLAVFKQLSQTIEKLIKDGHAIKTPLFNILPSITGVFENKEDYFDSARHQVRLRTNPGTLLRLLERNVTTEKVLDDTNQLLISNFFDNYLESKNFKISPGKIGRVQGRELKIAEKDKSQGVFFINTQTGDITKTEKKLLKNTSKELLFINPILPSGNYLLEVCNADSNKSRRSGKLEQLLTVSPE